MTWLHGLRLAYLALLILVTGGLVAWAAVRPDV